MKALRLFLQASLPKAFLLLLVLQFCTFAAKAQVLFLEDFSTGSGSTPPTGWTNTSTLGSDWDFDDACGYSDPVNNFFAPGNAGISGRVATGSSICSGGEMTTELTSPAFDASVAGSYNLEFDMCIRGSIALCEVSVWNGLVWTVVYSKNQLPDSVGNSGPTAVHRMYNITSQTGGYNAAKVKFYYHGDGGGFGGGFGQTSSWTVDNIKVTRFLCISPTVNFTVVPDCANSQYGVVANVTSMGSATSVAIKNGNTVLATAMSTGSYPLGNFTSGSINNFVITHNVDSNCNNTSGPVTYACGIANDLCSGAQTLTSSPYGQACIATSGTTVNALNQDSALSAPNAMSCLNGYTGADVWYKFVATTAGQQITVNPVSAVQPSANINFAFILYSGSCGSLNNIVCGNGGSIETTFGGVSTYPATAIVYNLIPGNTYYVRVMQGYTTTFSFGGGSQIADAKSLNFDICVQELAPPPPCTTTKFPLNNEPNLDMTNAPHKLAWYAVPGALSYDVYIGTDSTAPSFYLNIQDTLTWISAPLNATDPGGYTLSWNTVYYWYVVPRGAQGVPATGCQANLSRFKTCLEPPPPPNDICGTATLLPMGQGYPEFTTISTNIGATNFGQDSLASTCTSFSVAPADVWFKAIVPASGKMKIQDYKMNHFHNGFALFAYSGICDGGLSLIGCHDNDYTISLDNMTPGDEVYIRVFDEYGNHSKFSISAWDPDIVRPISDGGNCISGVPLTVDYDHGNIFKWNPIFDNSGKIIGELYANGQNLGIVNTKVYVNTTGTVRDFSGHKYLDRNITVTPQFDSIANINNISTGSVNGYPEPTTWDYEPYDVQFKFYAKEAEINALYAAAPSLNNTLDSIRFSKNEDPCQSALMGQDVVLTPGGINTQPGLLGYRFQINGIYDFSSFYGRGDGTTPLPITLLNFSGKNNGKVNDLYWETVREKGFSHFELQRSADGSQYTTLSKINGKQNESGSTYSYQDAQPLDGNNLYRLKLVDKDGKYNISNIVLLNTKAGAGLAVRVFPNPAKQMLNVVLSGEPDAKATIEITDIVGKKVKVMAVKNANINIDISGLAGGTYILKYSDSNNGAVVKFVKQ